jgi:DNA-binding MarR family transcriptional regulator
MSALTYNFWRRMLARWRKCPRGLHNMRVLEAMLKAEADIMEKLSGLPIDPIGLAASSNIWRTSQLFRQKMEREVLQEYNLTWASFSTLFIIWIWGPIEMGAIAESQSVGRSTITSTVSLLEKRGLCRRDHADENRRSVFVTLTPEGERLIKEVFPAFNRQEKDFVAALTDDEAETLARLLRKIIAHHSENK